jgi:LysR family glycine cleavage system transcriptional activator
MADPLARISLSAIRVFEAAARRGSFTRAADELGMTQAAVSWQIKHLEARLGRRLFERLPKEVRLTPAGERLARAAGEAMQRLRAVLEELSEQEDGVLAVTALQSFAAQWLAPRLGAFQIAHPKIAVRIETSARVMDLAREGVDVGVRSGGGRWPGLEAVRLFSSVLLPLCAPALKERLGGLSRPEDLVAAPRIGADRDWAQWFEAAGVVPPPGDSHAPRLVADVQTFEVAAAIAGQGVALASPILFAGELAAGRLAPASPVPIKVFGDYWVVCPQERARTHKVRAFRDWLLAQAAADPAARAYEP